MANEDRLAEQLETALASELSPAQRARIKATVMTAWDQRQAHPRPWWTRFSMPTPAPRWAAAALSLALVFGGGTGTVAASTGSVPGDMLYPVKELSEEARLWLARSPEEKVATYSRMVEERVSELMELTADGKYQTSATAVSRLGEHLSDLAELTQTDTADGADAGLTRSLEEAALVQQQVLGDIGELLQDAPPGARPSLESALSLIQQAKARVDAALDSLGR
ncbi:MAG: DUF5667 domain-containing protein [Dehalococcoidia bacterium]